MNPNTRFPQVQTNNNKHLMIKTRESLWRHWVKHALTMTNVDKMAFSAGNMEIAQCGARSANEVEGGASGHSVIPVTV